MKVEPSESEIVFGPNGPCTYFKVSNDSGDRVEFKLKLTDPGAFLFKHVSTGELDAY